MRVCNKPFEVNPEEGVGIGKANEGEGESYIVCSIIISLCGDIWSGN